MEKNLIKKKFSDNFSYKIKKGKFTSIIGPSGSGKTSLLKLISGIIKFKKGQIKFENETVQKKFKRCKFSSAKFFAYALVECLPEY